MRKWIDMISTEVEILEEAGRFKNAIAAAAIATAGIKTGQLIHAGNQPAIVHDLENKTSILDTGRTDQVRKMANDNLRMLALTMWAEARSDGPEAMRAVGHVILNRIHSERKFGKTVKDVVLKRKAFSCWNKSDPNQQAMKLIPELPDTHPSKKRWKEAVTIAKQILGGKDSDPTHGALFYHTTSIKPFWVTDGIKPIAKIANHFFYTEDGKAPEKTA